MKHWPLILAALAAPAGVWTGAQPAEASRAACLLQSDLVMFQHEARGFLEHLRTGNDPAKARQLSHWLEDHPVVTLRVRMRRSGMEVYEPLAIRLVTQQKGLLQVYNRHGNAKAEISAERLGTAALLEEFAARIIPLPCNFAPDQKQTAATPAGIGRIRGISQETAIASSLSVLLLAGGGLFLAERIARRHRRRRRRHPCSLNCSLKRNRQTLRAKLVDISRLGAKLRVWQLPGIPDLASKDEVLAVLPGLEDIPALVTWQNADYIGVKFSKPMAAEDLQALLKLSKKAAAAPAAETEAAAASTPAGLQA
ncbi:PilZ domain-containing protein [Leisingera sp. S132]|uniref:PilZ domain-containing protein n=1 Tax=Leisingera sp. S132 TaxID=2867016 RepID=UPI0021A4CD4E|nr:PilZ domain-containing protein [Leisingera sp. S132]UWQ81152.1 PilZ domain-containing protein [Leisingera sp. S132]